MSTARGVAAGSGPVAVIDIGAHSVRMEIAQVTGDGEIEILESPEQLVPLGRDVFRKGRIRKSNVDLCGAVLADYHALMKDYGIGEGRYRAFATSALREAQNREFVAGRLERISGLTVDVLEEAQEFRLLYLAMRECMASYVTLRGHQALLCMIGTGATHIGFVDNGLLRCCESIRVGTLRVVEELDAAARSESVVREIMDPFVLAIIQWLSRMNVGVHADRFVAVGATVRAIACIDRPRPSQKEAVSLSRKRFEQLACDIQLTGTEDLARDLNLSDRVAEGLPPCCIMLRHLFEITEADELLVPMMNTRDAVIRDLLGQPDEDEDPFAPDILAVAEQLGRRFHYDEQHANAVRNLSLRLFDKLTDLHELPKRCRLLLDVAAILHDIGMFISNRAHHKHSMYLIQNSQIPGLSNDELRLVSVIARYHRRATPRTSHLEYVNLSPEQRLTVAKLAAILRVADALDRSHQGRMRRIRLRVTPDHLQVSVPAGQDFGLERWGIQRKADLFEEVYGLDVVFTGRR